jgi:hypothetical protein
MGINKSEILSKICYTELVYGRINKKLNSNFSNSEIEQMLLLIIQETQEMFFQLIGKNVYVSSFEKNIRITINTKTFRVITVDKINYSKNAGPNLIDEHSKRVLGWI